MESIKNIIVRLRKRYGGMLLNLAHSKVEKHFSFCETQYATGTTPWHLRELTSQGKKLGGGADTRSLCDREVAWDLEVEITDLNLTVACPTCGTIFDGIKGV